MLLENAKARHERLMPYRKEARDVLAKVRTYSKCAPIYLSLVGTPNYNLQEKEIERTYYYLAVVAPSITHYARGERVEGKWHKVVLSRSSPLVRIMDIREFVDRLASPDPYIIESIISDVALVVDKDFSLLLKDYMGKISFYTFQMIVNSYKIAHEIFIGQFGKYNMDLRGVGDVPYDGRATSEIVRIYLLIFDFLRSNNYSLENTLLGEYSVRRWFDGLEKGVVVHDTAWSLLLDLLKMGNQQGIKVSEEKKTAHLTIIHAHLHKILEKFINYEVLHITKEEEVDAIEQLWRQ